MLVYICRIFFRYRFFCLGICLCLTIVGIPFGLQAFKKEGGADGCDFIRNALWIVCGGLWICIGSTIDGVIFYITICGIPWAKQCFRIAKLALLPFGTRVIEKRGGSVVNNMYIQQVNVASDPLFPPQ